MDRIVERLVELSSRIEDQVGEHGTTLVDATIRSVFYDGLGALITVVTMSAVLILTLRLAFRSAKRFRAAVAKNDDEIVPAILSTIFSILSGVLIVHIGHRLSSPSTWRSLFDPLAEVAHRLFL